MATRTAAIALIADKIKDDHATKLLLDASEKGQCLDQAIYDFSAHKPRLVTVDITGQTTPYLAVSSLTSWVHQWSSIERIEYPAEAIGASYVPNTLDPNDYDLYQDATGEHIFFRTITPVAADIIRITYRAPHVLLTEVTGVDTIPAAFLDAVCDLAAAYCLRRLAAKASATSDPTVASDVSSYRDAQMRLKSSADIYEDQYRRRVGLPSMKEFQKAMATSYASINRDWDTKNSWGGEFLLHHGRRR